MRGDGGIGVEPGFAAHPDIALRGVAPRETWPLQEPAAARTALRAESRLDEDCGPAAVVDVLRRSLLRDAVVTTDSGAHLIVLTQLYECYRPRGLLQSSALCTMGCAVPLAIGRKLAEPERTVVATVDDAGLGAGSSRSGPRPAPCWRTCPARTATPGSSPARYRTPTSLIYRSPGTASAPALGWRTGEFMTSGTRMLRGRWRSARALR